MHMHPLLLMATLVACLFSTTDTAPSNGNLNVKPLPHPKCAPGYITCTDDLSSPSCCGPSTLKSCVEPSLHLCCPHGDINCCGICCKKGYCHPGDICSYCPVGQYEVNGICCYNPKETNCAGSCCGQGAHCSSGQCCPFGTEYDFTQGVCCQPGQLCCPYGQTVQKDLFGNQICCNDGERICYVGGCCSGTCLGTSCCVWPKTVCNGVCMAAGQIC